MLEDDFSVVQERYELAKIYAMTCDLDNLGKMNFEISNFRKGRDMSESELEYVHGAERIIDRHLSGIVEWHLASIWKHALGGDLHNMQIKGGGCLDYFNELKENNILSNSVVRYAKGRLEEMWWICKSSANMSLLESFNNACLREDGEDIMSYLDMLDVFVGESMIKGPCSKH